MRTDYIIFPEAKEKLQNSIIEDRIEDLKKSEDGLPYQGGLVYKDQIRSIVNELNRRSYYDTLPEDVRKHFKGVMEGIFKEPENYFWEVERPERVVKEQTEIEDLELFSGNLASLVMERDEIWDNEKFGFASPIEFAAIVSAYIREKSRTKLSDYRKGYEWVTKREDGSEMVSRVTGSVHGDLRIFQDDNASYKTTDPFGNDILFRPKLKGDEHWVSGYHSTEPELLVSLIKYIEQLGIETDIFDDGARSLIEWTKSEGYNENFLDEHGIFDLNMLYVYFDVPIPKLDDNLSTDERSLDYVVTDSEGSYKIYIGPKNELMFSYESMGQNEPKKNISATFLPQEVEHLVKGLLFQTAKRLGRTSSRKMISTLKYRFSDQFQKDRHSI